MDVERIVQMDVSSSSSQDSSSDNPGGIRTQTLDDETFSKLQELGKNKSTLICFLFLDLAANCRVLIEYTIKLDFLIKLLLNL